LRKSVGVVDPNVKPVDGLAAGKHEHNIDREKVIDDMTASSYWRNLDRGYRLIQTMNAASGPPGKTEHQQE
jgi:hypothetical protein